MSQQVQMITFHDQNASLYHAQVLLDGDLILATTDNDVPYMQDGVSLEVIQEVATNLAKSLKAPCISIAVSGDNLLGMGNASIDATEVILEAGLNGFGRAAQNHPNIAEVSTEYMMEAPVSDYTLQYTAIDDEGNMEEGAFSCEAGSPKHALEQVIENIEGTVQAPTMTKLVRVAFEDGVPMPVSLLHECDADGYRLICTPQNDQAYIRAGNMDVRVKQTDEGVVVDFFDAYEGGLDPFQSTWVTWNDALPDERLDLDSHAQLESPKTS